MKKFTIEVEMQERWIPQFMSMLKRMEHLGDIGSSRKVTMFSDGDGDFRPKFKSDVEYEDVLPTEDTFGNEIYDAG